MIREQLQPSTGPEYAEPHTLWGMDAERLHEEYWAARGVQVVRTGQSPGIDANASLYLLIDPSLLVLLDPERPIDRNTLGAAELAYVRVHDTSEPKFRERVVTDDTGQFVRFERHYDGGPYSKLARVLLTADPRIAALWQMAPEPALAARAIQQIVRRRRRVVISSPGRLYDIGADTEETFILDLVKLWSDPSAALDLVRPIASRVYAPLDLSVGPLVRFVGPVWIGAGRHLEDNAVLVGPLVLWDECDTVPEPPPLRMRSRTPASSPMVAARPAFSTHYRILKRGMDILAAIVALAITLPLYPIILLAIFIEDGRPFFFTHRRETLGGRKFGCIKFRSMRKDAEKVKQSLQDENNIDGPQFFIKKDPRLTRVGAFIRKRQLDELPQFLNVLLGHMSVVGPRPSPYAENQFCPPWREARLSVRPGITGLWQVKRTRVADADFQEWIKYDLEYVQRASLLFDIQIIFKTALMFLERLRGRTVA